MRFLVVLTIAALAFLVVWGDGWPKRSRKMQIHRKPQGAVYAYLADRGRVWVESINSAQGTALVRFDPNLGMRSRVHKVSLAALDFDREWKRLKSEA